MSLENARGAIVTATHRYARRQMSYFRRWSVDWLQLDAKRLSTDPTVLARAVRRLEV